MLVAHNSSFPCLLLFLCLLVVVCFCFLFVWGKKGGGSILGQVGPASSHHISRVRVHSVSVLIDSSSQFLRRSFCSSSFVLLFPSSRLLWSAIFAYRAFCQQRKHRALPRCAGACFSGSLESLRLKRKKLRFLDFFPSSVFSSSNLFA